MTLLRMDGVIGFLALDRNGATRRQRLQVVVPIALTQQPDPRDACKASADPMGRWIATGALAE
jgi:hypothetical protein